MEVGWAVWLTDAVFFFFYACRCLACFDRWFCRAYVQVWFLYGQIKHL